MVFLHFLHSKYNFLLTRYPLLLIIPFKNRYNDSLNIIGLARCLKYSHNLDVSCLVNGEDQYGRQLATCYNNKNEDLNAEMVKAGHAIAYLFYSTKYEDQQDEARDNKNGIWSGE